MNDTEGQSQSGGLAIAATRGAPAGSDAPQRWQLVLAFGLVYVVWGSTYLAIRFALETLPPFLMSGSRFLVAGGLLYAWARLYGGAEPPTRAQWRATAITGVFLFLLGNGAVVWAELETPSGVVALIVGVVPFCMVLLDWLRPGGVRPGAQVVTGAVSANAPASTPARSPLLPQGRRGGGGGRL